MQRKRSKIVVDEQFLLRLGKMLSDPLRMNIIYECRIRPTSPRGFRERFGGPSPLPGSVRSMMASRFLESLLGRARSAIGADTFHARPDSQVSWTPLALDEQGWTTVIEQMDALFYELFEEQKRADERMAESGEEPISMTVAMLGFESPDNPGMMR